MVRKAVDGPITMPVEGDEDELSIVLQLSFLHKNYEKSFQEAFNHVGIYIIIVLFINYKFTIVIFK